MLPSYVKKRGVSTQTPTNLATEGVLKVPVQPKILFVMAWCIEQIFNPHSQNNVWGTNEMSA